MEESSTKRKVGEDGTDSDFSGANEEVPSYRDSAEDSVNGEGGKPKVGEKIVSDGGKIQQTFDDEPDDDELLDDEYDDDSHEEEPGTESEGLDGEDEAPDSESDNAMADEEKVHRAKQLRDQLSTNAAANAIKTLFSLKFSGDSSTLGKHYLMSGGSLDELINQLQYIDAKRKSQTIIIFQAIQITIIRIQQEKLMDMEELSELCKQFVTNYIIDVLAHLRSSSSVANQKTALRLLSALATINDAIALQLLSSVDFPKDQLKMLTLHVDPSQTACLRILYIHFIMSLIIGHSTVVIRKLCNKSYWLSSIFLGLRYDLLSTVGLVLKTLDDHVVLNMAIPKTSKLFVFNSKSLVNLAALYDWDPASFLENSQYRDNKLKIKPTEPEERDSVRELVHGVLLNLVTSRRCGVIFNDPSFGTTSLVANATVSHFMKDCGQPWEDPLKEELISKMLSTCPDLMKSFYNMIHHEQGPHVSKWNKVAAFLSKTISNITINAQSFMTLSKACNISLQIFLPSVLLDNVAESLKDSRRRSVEAHMRLFASCLSKIKEISMTIESRNSPMLKPYIARIAGHICYSSITPDKMLNAMRDLHVNKDISGIRAVCDVMFLLHDLVPQTLDPIKFNGLYVGELRKIMDLVDEPCEPKIVLKIKLLRLQLLLDPQIVKRDGAFHLKEICALCVPNSPQHIKSLGLSMIRDVLLCTGFFCDDTWEVDLWMACIKDYVQPAFGSKLAAAIRYAEHHKFELSNMVLRSHHQRKPIIMEALDFKLDDFLTMEDVDSEELNVPSQNLRLSPLLPGFLKANEKMGNVTKAFVIHYAHMVPTEGFITLIKEALGKRHLIIDYMAALARGECVSVNFSPFAGTTFEEISNFILNEETAVDCASMHSNFSQMEPVNMELAVSQIIRFALASQNNPQLFTRCVELLKKLCTATDDGAVSFKAEKVLRYFGLLDGFHPILSVTSQVNGLVKILGHAVQDRDHPNLKPFAHRIYSELEYAATKQLRLQDVNKDDLVSFLQIFPMGKNQIVKLIDSTFVISDKLFVTKGQMTPWVNIFEHLLSTTSWMRLSWSEHVLVGALQKVDALVRHPEVSQVPDLIHDYMSKVHIELSGSLLDASIELLRSLCNADNWYEPLACYLMTRVHDQLGELPEGIEFQREVMLIASTPQPRSRNLDHCCRAAVKSLSSDQKFLKHLADISSDAFSSETSSKMASKVVKHSSDIYPSSNALKVLEAVFKKADKALDLLHLVLEWLETYISQNPELCPGIATSFENVATNIDGDLLPALNEEIMGFFVEEGMNRSCKSMVEVLRMYLVSDRLPSDPRAFFQKLAAHQQFDNALMGADETFKCSVISLLYTLIEKDGSLVNGERLPGFLSAYQATLARSDQLLLKILQQYEETGLNLGGYKPLLWGNAALSHYSVKKKPSLSQSHPYQTLNALSPSVVINTIANFPIHRDVQGLVDGDSKVYDPAFILPILCNVALPGHKIKSRTFFQTGAVGLALASLASSSPNIRRIATLFLQRLHENHIGLDKIVWSNFIETVRHGIAATAETGKTSYHDVDVPRISSITATFLARASVISADPSAPLYRPLHHFFLARAAMNLTGVPAFLELIHSADLKNHERHREWILEVIGDGMREPRDLQIVLNSYTFKIMLAFYSSSLVKPPAKRIIEDIVEKCLLADKEISVLIPKYGILPWVLAANKPHLTAALPKLSSFSPHAPLLSLDAR